jgi:hypothetical protein
MRRTTLANAGCAFAAGKDQIHRAQCPDVIKEEQ